jgi:hypothetical protein
MSRSDPIRVNYFDALEKAERVADWLFYAGAVLSIMSLFVEKSTPLLYDVVLTVFAVTVLGLFGVGLAVRLYFMPRAEDGRRKDFFSSACGVNLTHQQTDGYYNNEFTDPIKRMAAQVFENSHFSKAIARRMARTERIKFGVYATFWLACLIYRRMDIGIVVAASQAVFSEQVVSKLIRLEWLRMRFETTYDKMFNLFQSNPAKAEFSAITLDTLSMYETAKSNAAVTLSSKLFGEMNVGLSAEWEQIKAVLKMRM